MLLYHLVYLLASCVDQEQSAFSWGKHYWECFRQQYVSTFAKCQIRGLKEKEVHAHTSSLRHTMISLALSCITR